MRTCNCWNDFVGIDRSALISIIAMGMITCTAGGDHANCLSRTIVPVTKPSTTPNPKAVVIADYSPDIQKSRSTVDTIGNVLERHAFLAALPGDGVGRSDDSPVFFFLNGKAFQAAVNSERHSNAPRNILGRKLASIFDTDVAKYRVTISKNVNAARLDTQVGSLIDPRITEGANGVDGQKNSKNRENPFWGMLAKSIVPMAFLLSASVLLFFVQFGLRRWGFLSLMFVLGWTGAVIWCGLL
jgi:hypothetical protein